jgi:hypothetical protein
MNEFGRNKEVRLGSMLRLTFLRVILYHPEYLTLNEHPTPEPISIFTDLNEEYWNQHFLVALLINEINEVMKGESSRRQQGR